MKPTYKELQKQLTESRREFTAANATIHNLELRVAQVVAENAGLKSKGREVLKEAAYVYSHYNRMVNHLDGESIDGQTLHEFQFVLDVETTATDAYLNEVRAQGVEALAAKYESEIEPYKTHDEFMNAHYLSMQANAARKFAAQLRQGVEHE